MTRYKSHIGQWALLASQLANGQLSAEAFALMSWRKIAGSNGWKIGLSGVNRPIRTLKVICKASNSGCVKGYFKR